MGQFRALEGSNPTLGSQGSVETVEEWLVEMVCEQDLRFGEQRITQVAFVIVCLNPPGVDDKVGLRFALNNICSCQFYSFVCLRRAL